MKKLAISCFVMLLVLAAVSANAGMKKQSKDQIVSAITQMENEGSKANLAGDISFVQKNYADDWTGGFSGGIWTTKDSLLSDAKDSANNKMTSEQISDLKVRVYGDSVAIATYTDSYDGMIRGEHRTKTVLSTDTWGRMSDGSWKMVASHSCVKKDS